MRLRDNLAATKTSKKNSNPWKRHNKRGQLEIPRYVDFGQIQQFSAAPAVILAAIYDRAKTATGCVPPAINFTSWSSEAFQTLYEIGFFEIIGHGPVDRVQKVYIEKRDTSYQVSKILTGKNADGLEEASDIISELLGYLSVEPRLAEVLLTEVNSAVSEAMINVARHAYPQEFEDSSPLLCLKKWWMSAKADIQSNTLTIVVYDQGATIPGTLPERGGVQAVLIDALKPYIPNIEQRAKQGAVDHEYINFSMREGKTQTKDPQRGLGLPQMRDLIDQCPDGTLTIMSRRGLYKYAKNVTEHKRKLEVALEGTLIEWELTLPREG